MLVVATLVGTACVFALKVRALYATTAAAAAVVLMLYMAKDLQVTHSDAVHMRILYRCGAVGESHRRLVRQRQLCAGSNIERSWPRVPPAA